MSTLTQLHSPAPQPLASPALTPDLQLTHTRLLQKLVADEPHTGYCTPSQIPPLTSLQLAAVMENDESVLTEAGADRTLNTALVNILAQNPHSTIEQAALVGAAVLGALNTQARTTLLYLAREDIERDSEHQRADAADELAQAAGSVAARRALR